MVVIGAGSLPGDVDRRGPSRLAGYAALLAPVTITHVTDPACPFAFSAEPVRQRIRFFHGDDVEWRLVVVNLTAGDPHEAERLAEGAPTLQRLHGMPIDPRPRARPISTEPACRALVGARRFQPGSEWSLFRRLAVLWHAGGMIDDAALLARAIHEAGLNVEEAAQWLLDPRVSADLAADMAFARAPSATAARLEHRLGGPPEQRRYSTGSSEIEGPLGRFSLPGFNPIEAYEAALANVAAIERCRPAPGSAREVLEAFGEPLASAELALITRAEPQLLRAELARVAHCLPMGADCYWSLEAPSARPETAVPATFVEAVRTVSRPG